MDGISSLCFPLSCGLSQVPFLFFVLLITLVLTLTLAFVKWSGSLDLVRSLSSQMANLSLEPQFKGYKARHAIGKARKRWLVLEACAISYFVASLSSPLSLPLSAYDSRRHSHPRSRIVEMVESSAVPSTVEFPTSALSEWPSIKANTE